MALHLSNHFQCVPSQVHPLLSLSFTIKLIFMANFNISRPVMSWTTPFEMVLTRSGANYGSFYVDDFKNGKEKGVFVNSINDNAIHFPPDVEEVYHLKRGDRILAVNGQLLSNDIIEAVKQIQNSRAPAIFTIKRLSAAKKIPTTQTMAHFIQWAKGAQRQAPPAYFGHGNVVQVSEGVFYV